MHQHVLTTPSHRFLLWATYWVGDGGNSRRWNVIFAAYRRQFSERLELRRRGLERWRSETRESARLRHYFVRKQSLAHST